LLSVIILKSQIGHGIITEEDEEDEYRSNFGQKK
jgi:hypothetical protein